MDCDTQRNEYQEQRWSKFSTLHLLFLLHLLRLTCSRYDLIQHCTLFLSLCLTLYGSVQTKNERFVHCSRRIHTLRNDQYFSQRLKNHFSGQVKAKKSQFYRSNNEGKSRRVAAGNQIKQLLQIQQSLSDVYFVSIYFSLSLHLSIFLSFFQT